jgi:hypothetical protein
MVRLVKGVHFSYSVFIANLAIYYGNVVEARFFPLQCLEGVLSLATLFENSLNMKGYIN